MRVGEASCAYFPPANTLFTLQKKSKTVTVELDKSTRAQRARSTLPTCHFGCCAQGMERPNFLGEGRSLITNKGSLIGTIGVDEEPACKFLQVASVLPKNTYPAGALGKKTTRCKGSSNLAVFSALSATLGEMV